MASPGDGTTSRFARRIGSQAPEPARPGAPPPAPRRLGTVWTLRLLPFFLLPPIVSQLAAGHPTQAGAGIAAILLLLLAGRLMQLGQAEAMDFLRRRIASPPFPPKKLLGHLTVALAFFLFSVWGAKGGLFGWGDGTDYASGAIFAFLGGAGSLLAYGMDPLRGKGPDRQAVERAGLRPEQVVQTLAEAEAKIRRIEQAAAGLHGAELVQRLARITAQARRVLDELERDPRDLARARRFLVTYLDGTQDVVARYAEQQHDLAETPLAQNFRRVLETVEQVFVEQEAVLKRDDALDLDVKIEVLETQLKREGVT